VLLLVHASLARPLLPFVTCQGAMGADRVDNGGMGGTVLAPRPHVVFHAYALAEKRGSYMRLSEEDEMVSALLDGSLAMSDTTSLDKSMHHKKDVLPKKALLVGLLDSDISDVLRARGWDVEHCDPGRLCPKSVALKVKEILAADFGFVYVTEPRASWTRNRFPHIRSAQPWGLSDLEGPSAAARDRGNHSGSLAFECAEACRTAMVPFLLVDAQGSYLGCTPEARALGKKVCDLFTWDLVSLRSLYQVSFERLDQL
jgi:hypothetical protein